MFWHPDVHSIMSVEENKSRKKIFRRLNNIFAVLIGVNV